MGEAKIEAPDEPLKMRLFVQRLIDDVRALERMLAENAFEQGITRIGAEQEMFLIDPVSHRPAMKVMEMLRRLDDPHFTTELGAFNMECNLDPRELGAGSLRALEDQLVGLLDKARAAGREENVAIFLAGILPTLEKSDLAEANMAPVPRYGVLARALRRLRGEDFQLFIKGRDELTLRHENVMLEAANTSFQFHLQVHPSRFARLYNIAQVATAPVLALGTFSPLFLGRRLWSETRIALFTQAVDTRRGNIHHRFQRPRVHFGDGWVDESVLEIFRQDISAFRVLLTSELGEDPLAALDAGRIPDLKALRLHNGTVYRWNRACYGIIDGVPHLRIENRVLPAGPTPLDEIANSAFWLGLVLGMDQQYGDIRPLIRFDDAYDNFLAAARTGLKAQLTWLDGRDWAVGLLTIAELAPLARQGLASAGISAEEIDRYIGTIEERVRAAQNGSSWMIDSLAGLGKAGNAAERHGALVKCALEQQQEGNPVHTWPLATLDRAEGGWQSHYAEVGNLMSTELVTVSPDEVLELVACLMDWQQVHHIPVEDAEHRLVGMISHRRLLRHLAQHPSRRPVAVREVMATEVSSVGPHTPSLDAIRLMKDKKITALPVVEDGILVGIVTEHDFLRVADKLLEDFLKR
jgi:CBS domain-containing protein